MTGVVDKLDCHGVPRNDGVGGLTKLRREVGMGRLYFSGTALMTFLTMLRPSSVPKSKAPMTPRATPTVKEEKEPSCFGLSDGVVICVDIDRWFWFVFA